MEIYPVVSRFVLFAAKLVYITALFAAPVNADTCGGRSGGAGDCVCCGDNSIVANLGWYVWNFDKTPGGASVNERTGETFMLNPSALIPVFGTWTTAPCADFSIPKPLLPENSLLKLGFDETTNAAFALPSRDRYKVAVFDGYLFDNFEAVTYFRIDGGENAQAVGLVFGCQGEEFYIARVGSEDNKATLYRYHDGKKYRIADAPQLFDSAYSLVEKWLYISRFETEFELYKPNGGSVAPGTWTAGVAIKKFRWHELRVRRDKGVIEVSLNGERLLRCLDLALRYGKVGYFVKGDTQAYFTGIALKAW